MTTRRIITLLVLPLLVIIDVSLGAALTRYFPWYLDADPPELRASDTPTMSLARGSVVADTCERALRAVSDPPAQPAQAADLILSREASARLANRLLAAQFHFTTGQLPAYFVGPELLSASLPDGRAAQVWAVVWIPYPSGATIYSGNAAVVYVMAHSPHDTYLYSGVTVINPASVCQDGSRTAPFYPQQTTPLWAMLLTCALPVLNVGVLVGWYRRVC